MKQIEPQALLEILRPQRLRHELEIVLLHRECNEAFRNDTGDCHALVHGWVCHGESCGATAYFTGQDDTFIREVLQHCEIARFLVTVVPGDTLRYKPGRSAKEVKEYCAELYGYDGPVPAGEVDSHIRRLESDGYSAVEHPFTKPLHPDDLTEMRPVFYTWYEGEQAAAVLASWCDAEDIWRLVRFHILPEREESGIDEALMYAFLRDTRERGLLPYVPGSATNIRTKALRRAGFQLCATSHAFEYKKPKH